MPRQARLDILGALHHIHNDKRDKRRCKMVTQLKEEFEIPDKLKDIYRKIEVSPVGILRNYALNLIHSKI
jgi:hypothetical protein